MNDTSSKPAEPRPPSRPLFYRVCQAAVTLVVSVLYRFRVIGRKNVTDGPLLIVANHQSHLDPPLIGVAVGRRPVLFLARSGLFKSKPLAVLIRGLGAVSLNENESDTAAMKKAIALLNEGHIVGIFPEGTRTPDGEVHEFKRGAWLLMSRAKCDVLPVAIEGAFEAWPRGQTLPALFGKRAAVRIGRPIPFAKLKTMGPDEGLSYLRQHVDGLRQELVEMLGKHAGTPARRG